MSDVGFKLDMGWRRFQLLIDPKLFGKRMQKELLKANQIVGLAGARAARKAIQKGKYAKNAALTEAIKGSNAPLKGTAAGGLFQAISYKVVRWDEVFVGVLRTEGKYSIAKAIHDGTSIKVTDKMRSLFRALWLASEGKINPSSLSGRAAELFSRFQDWRPLRASTHFIVIPSRPFMRVAFEDEDFRQTVKRIWSQAIQRALSNGRG